MMKKASKEKQQVWNRSRSELLGADHKQAWTLLRAELAPGYYISSSGKRAIKVLHTLGKCYMHSGSGLHVSPVCGLQLSKRRLIRYSLRVVRKGAGSPVGSEVLLHQHLIFY